MLIEGRQYQVLNLDDINSLVSLEAWVKKNLSLFDEEASLPSGKIEIFLNYIKEKVKSQKPADKSEWLEKLDSLEERLIEKRDRAAEG